MTTQTRKHTEYAGLLSRQQILDAITPFLYPAGKISAAFVSANVKGMDDIVISFALHINEDYVPFLKATQQAYEITESEIADHIAHTDFGYTLTSLMDILKGQGMWDDSDDNMKEEFQFYVLTNKNTCYGAAAIANPVVLQNLRETFKCSLYIFPSSVHEVLLMPVQNMPGTTPDALADMVRNINQSDVAPEEFLSDHVYLYDYERNCIRTLA